LAGFIVRFRSEFVSLVCIKKHGDKKCRCPDPSFPVSELILELSLEKDFVPSKRKTYESIDVFVYFFTFKGTVDHALKK